MLIVLKSGVPASTRDDLEKRVRSLGAGVREAGSGGDPVLVVEGDASLANAIPELRAHPAVSRIVAPNAPAEAHAPSRRTFLDVFIGVTIGVFVLAAGSVATFFLWSSGRRRQRREILEAGKSEEFDLRPSKVLDAEGEAIIVLRTASRDYKALSAICTHSEICRVEWDPKRQQIVCPCHRAAYDVYGNVLEGPPPRPLRSYPIHEIDGKVFVRTRV